jgi:hypothetical protein
MIAKIAGLLAPEGSEVPRYLRHVIMVQLMIKQPVGTKGAPLPGSPGRTPGRAVRMAYATTC